MTSSLYVAPSVRRRGARTHAVAARWRVRLLRHPALAAVSIFALGAVIEWVRLPASDQDTLWAEDIRNFLGNAVTQGPSGAFAVPYAGYLHTVPRLIAGLVVQTVPLADWANAMAFCSCLVVAGVAALVFVCARDVLPGITARLGLVAITLFVPLAPREVLGNTANLHWYFLWLAPWLLLYRPRSRSGAWPLSAVALLAALTEIQLVAFVPLLVWRWRDRVRLPGRAVFLAGVVVQLIVTVAAPRAASTAHPVPAASVAYGYLINAVMTSWSADPRVIGWMLLAAGPVAGILLILPFLAAAAVVFVRGSRLQRLLAGVCVVSSVAFYAVAVEVSPGVFYDYATMTSRELADPWLARYGVVPSMFLLALVPLALAALAWPRVVRPRVVRVVGGAGGGVGAGRVVERVVSVVVLVLFAAVLVAGYSPAWTRRDHGPLWHPQVVAMEAYCDTASPFAVFRLVGAPSARWGLDLTCAQSSGSP